MTEAERLNSLMEGIAQMRESMKAVIAGLMADGFSEEQARDIVAGFWRMAGKDKTDE